MPRTIDEGFRDFLTKLTPSNTETQAAKTHRVSIKNCLENNFGLNRFVRIGSFGNGTSISGYSDVDYLAHLPSGEFTNSSNYTLSKVRNALNNRFPNTGVKVSCPAVVVPFGTKESETTEIVPADYLRKDDYKVYDIADCSNGWMEVSPDAHNAYVKEIDDNFNGKVKPLIRFIKAWKYYQNVPISSFYLELRIAKYASEESSIIYDIDVKQIFCRLRDNELARMRDPMGVSGLISACKSEADKKIALSKLKTATTRAENARNATSNEDISDAFYWWRLLYNNQFPTYYR